LPNFNIFTSESFFKTLAFARRLPNIKFWRKTSTVVFLAGIIKALLRQDVFLNYFNELCVYYGN
jgi:hypothetical protein